MIELILITIAYLTAIGFVFALISLNKANHASDDLSGGIDAPKEISINRSNWNRINPESDKIITENNNDWNRIKSK